MKKVIIYLPNLNFGGAESVTVRLANYLVNNGYSVQLITSVNGGILEETLDDRVEYSCLKLKNQWYTILKMPSVIRKVQPDIIFTTMKESCFIMILSKYLARSKARMVIREANTVSLQLKEEVGLLKKIKNFLIAISYHFSAKIIALSDEIKLDLMDTFKLPNRIDVIPNPIDFSTINNASELLIDNVDLINKDILKIVTVARFYPQKNHIFMIDALAKYINNRPNVKLFLVGDGPLRDKISERAHLLGISNNVVFLGFQKNPLAIVKACDLFVLPSIYEGFSNALLEAAALNKKILVSDAQATSVSFLKKINTGVFYKNNSIDDFCEKLEYLASSEGDYGISERMKNEYSSDAVFKSYSKVMFE
ncbi:glycosyltransferase [Vibrio cholerae]|uniref:glycosyltransferase n=1 Tax=Vibrio cholerae TaxID=666 RepID=UPI003080FED9